MKRFNLLTIILLSSTIIKAQSKEYDSLFASYKAATISEQGKVELVKLAQQNGFQPFAHKVAQSYIANLSEKQRLEESNLNFIISNTNATTDPGFTFLIDHIALVNQTLHSKSSAEQIAAYIIAKDDKGLANLSPNPNWDAITAHFEKQYGKNISDRLISATKIKFYKDRKDWEPYARSQGYYIEHYGDTYNISDLNNAAWDVFQNCNDTTNLQLALKWLAPYVKNTKEKPHYLIIDTYANLLYKLGKTQDAIQWEKTVVDYSKSNTAFVEVLNKMQNGKKTW